MSEEKLKKRASSWCLEQARFVQGDRYSQIMVSYPRYHASDLVWWSSINRVGVMTREITEESVSPAGWENCFVLS